MKVTDSVEVIKGVGPNLVSKLKKLGIETIEDLLNYYPRKYNDYSNLTSIKDTKPGEVTIKGYFKQVKGRYVRGRLHITEGVFSDDTSSVRIVWFNQPYRERAIKKGEQYFVSGVLDLKRGRFAITNPSCELVSDFPVNTARIIPIYRETKEIKSTEIRKVLRTVLQNKLPIRSYLPDDVEISQKLISKQEAITNIHFPETTKDIEVAKHRLGFEEIFELILSNLLLKQETLTQKALPVPFKKQAAQDFVKHLEFKLTDSQRRATWEVYQDIENPHPANRLLEGDVGSGKTVVAVMAALMCIIEGFQVALMAPTEILARQHAETIYKLLKPLGYEKTVCLLIGSMNTKQKNSAHKKIKDGEAKFIVGTHALIQEKVDIKNLALAIVDEQHRFGVDQRKALLKKAGHLPHLLSMTATPIPRSLALTVYGDLDISILKEKPKNRKPTITKLITPTHREKLYKEIDAQLSKGQQMFVVCPLIEVSDLMPAKSVTDTAEDLKIAFPKRKIAVLHGRLASDEKQKIMQNFIDKKTDILVSTTVIEVGVDVPNASIMMIESPERFGLAQIHQLRGRVGRSDAQGYCYLLLSDGVPPSRRLRAIEQSNDGFRLAELDLELRGPGAIYGSRQHGDLDLRLVSFTDTKLIKQARDEAETYAKQPKKLLQYPGLLERVKQLQKINHLN